MQKITINSYHDLKGIYFIVLFFFSAKATAFTYNFLFNTSFPQFCFLFLLTIFVVVKYNVHWNSKPLLISEIILLIWYISVTKMQGLPFQISIYITYSFILVLFFVPIAIFKERLFEYYEDICVRLTIVCLFFYLIQALGGEKLLTDLSFMKPAFGTNSGSFLIFNMSNSQYYSDTLINGWPRNSGFSWEPGRYSCMLNIAVVINLMKYKSLSVTNFRLVILIAGIITTFSTTGISVLMITIILFVLQNVSGSKRIIATLMLIPLMLYVLQLPFMMEKIKELSDPDKHFVSSETNTSWLNNYGEGEFFCPQRFEGLEIELLNVIDKPILGYGLNADFSYVNTMISDRISLSNGLLKPIAMFGIIIGSVLLFFVCISSIKLSQKYNMKNKYLLFVVYMGISISYSFFDVPLISSLFLYSMFNMEYKNNSIN